MSDFVDSMEEELKTCCAENQAWQGLTLVHDINPYRRGNGVFAVFYDQDHGNDLEQRMQKIMAAILSSRGRIAQLGYWPGISLAEIIQRGANDPKIRAAEVRFLRPSSAAA
jgi:hypothetical protein